MVYTSGDYATRWSQSSSHWSNLIVVVSCIVVVSVGLAVPLSRFSRGLYSHVGSKRQRNKIKSLQRRLAIHLRKNHKHNMISGDRERQYARPSKLAIYLGSFSDVKQDQLDFFSQVDTIILNPRQPDISKFVSHLVTKCTLLANIIGRIDLKDELRSHEESTRTEKELFSDIDRCVALFTTKFRTTDSSNGFSTVLLAGWQALPQYALHELCRFISVAGYHVYLETEAPPFLEESSLLDFVAITGLVIRNATILPNGERRDAFGMQSLKTTIKAFVSQSCSRKFAVLVWETLNDNAQPSNAVMQRTFAWCKFRNAVPWIGTQRALVDISTESVLREPFQAFSWLKNSRIMDTDEHWRKTMRVCVSSSGIASLDMTADLFRVAPSYCQYSLPTQLTSLLPSLEMSIDDCGCNHQDLESQANDNIIPTSVDLELGDNPVQDAINSSSLGESHTELGCFPIGMEVSRDDFQNIVTSQRRLGDLGLLDTVPVTDLHTMSRQLEGFANEAPIALSATIGALSANSIIKELAEKLLLRNGGNPSIRVFLGLQSGFRSTNNTPFWAVHDERDACDVLDIYMAKNVTDTINILLHTYLASKGVCRRDCFMIESSFADWRRIATPGHYLSSRIAQDVNLLTPEECLHLLQRMSHPASVAATTLDTLSSRLKLAILQKLGNIITCKQLQSSFSHLYIEDNLNVVELLQNRLEWHRRNRRQHPELGIALSLFFEIQESLLKSLRNREHDDIQAMFEALDTLLLCEPSATGDIFALSFFCTMRKQAFEEIYLEVADRNPLFNDQPDQAATFAELYALGSRCEIYFGMTANEFGELLTTRYRSQYEAHQPSIRQPLESTYAEPQIDIDETYKPRRRQHLTFLRFFAIPIIVHLLLLTITSHGLYYSIAMTQLEQHSATTAFMVSIPLSGAIGTWITCCGTYYLDAMAFAAMNYLVATRLLGGLALTILVGLIGFVAFCVTQSVYAGTIFLLLSVALTSSFSLVAALATYQSSWSTFQSGRPLIFACLPILFSAPTLSMLLSQHAIVIYLTTLYVFDIVLAICVVRRGARWTTWHQNLHLLTDEELTAWAISQTAAPDLSIQIDHQILGSAREKLIHKVTKERGKLFFSSRSRDLLVRRLSELFEATEFLMDWYSRTTGTPRPRIYTSSWNLQSKIALSSLRKMQRGIKFHNGFLHWRQAADEISLVWRGRISGLGDDDAVISTSEALALVYYLICAILLDRNSQAISDIASRQSQETIWNDGDIDPILQVDSEHRKTAYWRNLAILLAWHLCGSSTLGLLCILFGTSIDSVQVVIFLSYAIAYLGLLWFQYTKPFSGSRASKPLLTGAVAGTIVWIVLNQQCPEWIFSSITALGTATWTAAILSLWVGKIVGTESENLIAFTESSGTYRCYSGSDIDEAWSQSELQIMYENLLSLPESNKVELAPQSVLGNQVIPVLQQWSKMKLSDLAQSAFPDTRKILKMSSNILQGSTYTIKLVLPDHMPVMGRSVMGISHESREGSMWLFVVHTGRATADKSDPIGNLARHVAQVIVQTTAEKHFGYSSEDASLIQRLWHANDGKLSNTEDGDLLLNHAGSQTLDERTAMFCRLQKQILRDTCLGIDINLEFENLSADLRNHFIQRCLGVNVQLSGKARQDMEARTHDYNSLDLDTFIARRNFAAFSGIEILERLKLVRAKEPEVPADHGAPFEVRQLPSSRRTIQLDRPSVSSSVTRSLQNKTLEYPSLLYDYVSRFCKFFAIALAADPHYHRELDYVFPTSGNLIVTETRRLLLAIWRWAHVAQRASLPLFTLYGRKDMTELYEKIKCGELLTDDQVLAPTPNDGTADHEPRATSDLGLSQANSTRHTNSTVKARNLLWKAWKDSTTLDAVSVQWLDERILRRAEMLKSYWRYRDNGQLHDAKEYLDEHLDAVMAVLSLDSSISNWTSLPIRLAGLYSFGQGGDSCSSVVHNEIAGTEGKSKLDVIALDTGTWPNEGGGVSACRSDVVNNLSTIRWHMVAESGTDYGIPQRQIERNVDSLKILPLFGLDQMASTHGLFQNRLESEIDYVTNISDDQDIRRTFIPILEALIRGARALNFRPSDVKQATRALINLNAYFEQGRDWSTVWRHPIVKSAWRYLWLSQTMGNARPSSQWLKAELPTIADLDQSLEFWSRYLFIFSIPIPEEMPPVFQASHHSVSAAYGIVCKLKHNRTLQIWDHAISWREQTLFMSSTICPLLAFTRNSLLGLMRMTSILTLHHADMVLPCADVFNPDWEVEIGTARGLIEDRTSFRRKIDPVMNGITNMERFVPIQKTKTKTPTVTMLSHVWFAKDIKTALLAADIIINEWGFREYTLEIYGALDKDPIYVSDCQTIIATKSLSNQVCLKGEADAIHVLERTWLFLNSSISEGLPLAVGEAALTGAPIVCTDVGASRRVLTHPITNSCFSEIVAPNDACALARAQIKLLALLGEWSEDADPASSEKTDDASFPEELSREDVERITRRMYEQSEGRRRVGLRAREIVRGSFSGERYLREHEQMLWVGKGMYEMRTRGQKSIVESGRPDSVTVVELEGTSGAVVDEHVHWSNLGKRGTRS